MAKADFVPGGKVTVRDLGGGCGRKVLAHNDSMMAVEVHFEEGAVGAEHTHPHTQISYVLEGELRYTVEGEAYLMKPGDSVCVESGAKHGTVCLKKGILLDVFAPARQDFLG